MANITVSNLQGLVQQDLNGSVPNVTAFYDALSNAGFGYAGLAEGVVTDTGMSGIVAQQFMANSAAQQAATDYQLSAESIDATRRGKST